MCDFEFRVVVTGFRKMLEKMHQDAHSKHVEGFKNTVLSLSDPSKVSNSTKKE